MVLLRDQVRQIALRDAGVEPRAWVVAQWGPFAVFVVLLVGGAVVAIALDGPRARAAAPAGVSR